MNLMIIDNGKLLYGSVKYTFSQLLCEILIAFIFTIFSDVQNKELSCEVVDCI